MLFPLAEGVGLALIVTLVFAAELVHPLTVTVTEYEPLFDVVVPVMLGFCEDELYDEGPLHA